MNPLEMCKIIFSHAESVRPQTHYFGLLAYYALAQAAAEDGDKAALQKVLDEMSRYPEDYLGEKYNFEVYRSGGNAKAYLLMLNKLGKLELPAGFAEKQREVIREYAEKTFTAPADPSGILSRPFNTNQIWIDVVTAVTPFMLYSGIVLDEEKYIDFAAEQCFKMYDVFLDHDCGLLHQSRGFREDPDALSEDHWSRGNGWCFIGLAELLRFLPKGSKWRPRTEEIFKSLAEASLKYQDGEGFWHQEMTREDCWKESSGTGMILYAYGAGLRHSLLGDEFKSAFLKGIDGLARLGVNKEGVTQMSCPGCLCPGDGTIEAYINEKKPFPDEPHSWGAIMLAFIEAARNGVESLAVGEE